MPADHDAYIAAAPEDLRPLLVRLRARLARALPDAEEIIAYKMPGSGSGKTSSRVTRPSASSEVSISLLPPSSRMPPTSPRPGSSRPRRASPSRRASRSPTDSSRNSPWPPSGNRNSERPSGKCRGRRSAQAKATRVSPLPQPAIGYAVRFYCAAPSAGRLSNAARSMRSQLGELVRSALIPPSPVVAGISMS